jgi:hypothetical protein
VRIEQGTIPKTSSGKIMRRATRAGYLDGTLVKLHGWRAPQGSEPPAPAGPTLTAGLEVVLDAEPSDQP